MTLLLCAALPLAAAAIITVAGRRIGRRGTSLVSVVALALAFGAALAIAQAIAAGRATIVAEIGRWLPLRGGEFSLSVDGGTLPLLLAATALAAVVGLTSSRAPRSGSFHIALLLGVVATVLLVTAANLTVVVAAWGIGSAATYLATSHDHEGAAAAVGAQRGFVFDRASDAALVLAALMYLALFRSLDLDDIAARVAAPQPGSDGALLVPSLLLVAGAAIRSAQVPFHPRALDLRQEPPGLAAYGSAFALGAGVILLIRLFGVMHPGALAVAATSGALTAAAGVILALSARDGREMLAWAGAASIGVAFLAAGARAPAAAAALLVVIAVLAAASLLPRSRAGVSLERTPRAPGRRRRAVAEWLDFSPAYAQLARGYRTTAGTLESGTEAALDGSLAVLGALVLRASRYLARAESAPGWRVEAIALAALVAFVAYWGSR